MKELLAVIIKNLVTDVDQIEIEQIEDENNILLKLTVSKDDIGKVIGKNGKIIRSIRAIIKAGAYDTKKRVSVEIVE